jgi:hypothetical protein
MGQPLLVWVGRAFLSCIQAETEKFVNETRLPRMS